MRIRLPIVLSLGLLGPVIGLPQTGTADDYFNRAAKLYVKEDKLAALKTLDLGLRQYPGDARMLKLADELLKDQQQQQQQQQEQQEQQQEKQKEEQGQEQKQQEQQGEERQEQRTDEMTKQDAERMLDALERKEQDVQERVRSKMHPSRQAAIEKDW